MTTHDEGVFAVPEEHAEEMLEIVLTEMRRPPSWFPTLPVAGTGGIGIRYGEAKD